MLFENPHNGHVEAVDKPWVWVLLFGCFYFAYKGVWSHFVISLLLTLIALGIASLVGPPLVWFVYSFFARSIMCQHYLHKGWR